MMQEELEDGEISDSDDDTSEIKANGAGAAAAVAGPAEYSLLPRPTNPAMSYRVPQGAPLIG